MATRPSGRGDWQNLSPAISKKEEPAEKVLAARRRRRQPTRRKTGQMFIDGEHKGSIFSGLEEALPWSKQKASGRQESSTDSRNAGSLIFLRLRMVLLAAAVPLLSLALAIRLVASSGFLWLEYQRSGFPADTYGFSSQDRMKYGSYGLEYILNFAPSSYLADLRTEQGSKLFLSSEVQHMTDVKHVLIATLSLAFLYGLLALLLAYSLRKQPAGTIRRCIFAGSIATLVLLLLLGILAALGWESFFTSFHQLFFPQGNWEFRLSDSLIRLYPPQFWTDAALAVASLVVLILAILFLVSWPTARRRARQSRYSSLPKNKNA